MISCRVSVVLTLVVLACLVPGSLARKRGKRPAKRAENVTCPSGKHNYYVELEAGKNFTFELEDYYGDRSRCRVEYRVGSCSNVIVQSIGYNLKGKSCYTRTVGEGKSDESKAMKVRVCAEDVEMWPANDTDSSEDPSKIGMMQDSGSWDDVGINQNFVMAFNAPKGVANKGNSIMLNVHCEAGIKYDPEEYLDCQCGLKNESSPIQAWEIESNADSNGDKYRGVLLAKEWALLTLPAEKEPTGLSFDFDGATIPVLSFEQISKTVCLVKIQAVAFDKAAPICLPDTESLKKNIKRGLSHGHQWLKKTKSFADDRTEFSVRILSKQECNKKLKMGSRTELLEGEGCLVPNKKNSPSVCQVDIGAPVYTAKDGTLSLLGLVSELADGAPCATKKQPARYQRLDKAVLDKISGLDTFTSCPRYPAMPNCFPPEDSDDLPSYCPADRICCGGICSEMKSGFECRNNVVVCSSDLCGETCCATGQTCFYGNECVYCRAIGLDLALSVVECGTDCVETTPNYDCQGGVYDCYSTQCGAKCCTTDQVCFEEKGRRPECISKNECRDDSSKTLCGTDYCCATDQVCYDGSACISKEDCKPTPQLSLCGNQCCGHTKTCNTNTEMCD